MVKLFSLFDVHSREGESNSNCCSQPQFSKAHPNLPAAILVETLSHREKSEAVVFAAADRELYSATLNNFLGTEPVILRNLGYQHYSMKSEYLPAWLNGTWAPEKREMCQICSKNDLLHSF